MKRLEKGKLEAGLILALLAFLAITLASVYASRYFRVEAVRESQTEFLRQKTVVQNELENELKRISSALYSLAAFFDGSELVTREEFGTFVAGLRANERHPSLFALSYLAVVKDEGLAAFEKSVRKEIPDFAVFPAGRREDHDIILYDNPFRGTKSQIGLDAAANSEAKSALDRARDTGEPEMSGMYTSVADPQRTIFFVTMPVYKKGQATATVEEKRLALAGFVAALYVKDDFFNQILTRLQPEGLDLEIFSGEAENPGSLIFDSRVGAGPAGVRGISASLREAGGVLTDKTTLVQYGRTWTVVYRYRPDRILTFWQLILPDLTIYGGLIFALLFCLLVLLLTFSRRAALRLAAQMTEVLKRFKLAVDSANSHIILTDPDGKILYVNPAAEVTTGYTPKEMLGNNPRLWGGLMGREFYEKMWHQIKEERRPWKGELKNRRKNGEIYNVLATVSPILDEDKNLIGFVGLEDDITAKVRVNEALAEAKAKDEAILAGIGDGVVVVDGEGKILLMNNAGERLMGWKSAEVVGKKYADVWSVKDDLGNVVATAFRPIQRALSQNETVSTSEYYLTRKDGGDFPAHITVSAVKREGKLVGAVMVLRDIAAEKAVDRAKSEFVSLASHQLRTPLSAVSWYTEMLLSGDLGPVAESQKKYIEEIHESNKRMVELVNALLNVSRIDLGTFAIEPEDVNLVEIAKSAVAELQPQIVFKKLTFAENYDPGVPVIQADPKLVRIIIGNLVTNAVKYTGEGGRGELGIRLAKAGETEGGKRLAGDGVLIKVSDSGYGIPQNQQDKVFTKLFRADNVKEKDTEGTGLGLYIVKAIVDAAAGLIWFESVENQGSTFYVFLPLSGMPRKAGAKQLGNDVFSKITAV